LQVVAVLLYSAANSNSSNIAATAIVTIMITITKTTATAMITIITITAPKQWVPKPNACGRDVLILSSVCG
jgi:hypothetical protein